MTRAPKLISSNNLSQAWAEAFLHVLEGDANDSMLVAIRDFDEDIPPQDLEIRNVVNLCLQEHGSGIPTIDQTALTIFPYNRWLRLGRPNISIIKTWYLENLLPRLKARSTKNKHGTYFERLINFSGVKFKSRKAEFHNVDQLQHVISLWNRGAENGRRPRQSSLQLSCFDPAKDHNGSALAGFPCLQQISLTYTDSGTLEIHAYYPTQFIFDRAYGNYLGLCHLGHALASELGLRLTAFSCYAARPMLGGGSKKSHREFASFLRSRLEYLNTNSGAS